MENQSKAPSGAGETSGAVHRYFALIAGFDALADETIRMQHRLMKQAGDNTTLGNEVRGLEMVREKVLDLRDSVIVTAYTHGLLLWRTDCLRETRER